MVPMNAESLPSEQGNSTLHVMTDKQCEPLLHLEGRVFQHSSLLFAGRSYPSAIMKLTS